MRQFTSFAKPAVFITTPYVVKQVVVVLLLAERKEEKLGKQKLLFHTHIHTALL